MGWRIETMTVSEKPARRRRKLWIILGAVVIVAVAVVGSLAYVSNRPGAAPLPPTGPNVTMWDNGFCSNSSNCGYSPGVEERDCRDGVDVDEYGWQASHCD